MSRFTRALSFATVLLLGLTLLGSNRAGAFKDDDKAVKEAQKEILSLAKLLEAGKDKEAAAAVKAMKKKYEDLAPIMHAYKPSTKGGIGYKGKAKGAGDGIESNIIDLGKRALAKAALEKQKDALVELAYINAAIADVTMAYAPTKPKAGKGAKEWKGFTEDMRKSALEIATAAKAGDAAKIKGAANNLNNSCNSCHSDFRD